MKLDIITRELRKIITSKSYLFTTFGIPFLLALYLFFGGLGASVENTNTNSSPESLYISPLSVVNLSSLELSEAMKKTTIKETELQFFESRSAAEAALKSSAISGYAIVPENYLSSNTIEVIEGSNLEASQYMGIGFHKRKLEKLIRIAVYKDKGLTEEAIEDILRQPKYLHKTINALGKLENAPSSESAEMQLLSKALTEKGISYLFVFVIIFIVIGNSGSLVKSMNAERESKLIDVLLTTVTPQQLLSGKVIGILLASLLQLVIWVSMVLALPTLAKPYVNPELSMNTSLEEVGFMIGFAILGMLFYGYFYAGMGALKKNPNELGSAKKLGLFLQVIPIYWLVFTLPTASTLTWRVLSFIPFLTPFLLPFQIIEPGFTAKHSIVYLLVMLLFTVGMGIFSARIFLARIRFRGQAVGFVRLIKEALRFNS